MGSTFVSILPWVVQRGASIGVYSMYQKNGEGPINMAPLNNFFLKECDCTHELINNF
jgi:hypothetical protein